MTISSAQCHPTVPESVSFLFPPEGQGVLLSFVLTLSLPLPLMVSCKLMYQVVTTSRFYSTLPSSSCIHVLAGGVTKTRTSVYEVRFP